MDRLCLLTILLLMTPLAAHAQQSLEDQLIAADLIIWQTIAGPHPDIAAFTRNTAPDYLDMELGVRHTREQVLHDLASVTGFSFHYENARACILSPSSGYVIAELAYSSGPNGSAVTGRVLTTTVFSLVQGHWLARLHTEQDMKPATTASH